MKVKKLNDGTGSKKARLACALLGTAQEVSNRARIQKAFVERGTEAFPISMPWSAGTISIAIPGLGLPQS